MQRELKFRAWDNKLKKWIVEGFHIFGETTLFNLIGQHCFETKGEGCSRARYADIEVTQYTGVDDKFGNPIYEGDIIDDGNNNFAPIEWAQDLCQFLVMYESEVQVLGEWCIVVGNIYEKVAKF